MAKAPGIAENPGVEKRPRIRFLAPLGVVAFLTLTLAGTYYVRLRLLEKAMALALEIGDEKTMGKLLDSWPCPVNAHDESGVLPLHWAAAHGRADLVERCLARKADVNALGRPGGPEQATVCPSTALYWAAFHGRNRDIVRVLVAHGADVNIGGQQDLPLFHAAEGGDEEMVVFLLSLGADVATSLRVAEQRHNQKAADILRAHGAKE